MKKTLLLALMLLVTASSFAVEEVEINGLWYFVVTKAKEAEVIQYKNDIKYSGNIVIPEIVEYNGVTCSVTSIGSGAFSGCTNLTSVSIPSTVTSIESYAFSRCSSLISVHISDLEAWCNIAFFDYTSNPLSFAQQLFLNGEEIKDLMIPSSATNIGNFAFYDCKGLTSVTIPNSVTSVGSNAFYGCSGLTSLAIGNGVTDIGNNTFCNCSSLNSVTIPNSVTSIGDCAFANCIALTTVKIPNNVTSMEAKVFYGCTGLTSVTISNSVTRIGSNAFQNCSGLTSITIPNSVTTIGNGAFSGCSSLTTIAIGNGIKDILYMAFANCPELTDVYCYADNVPSTNGNAFDGSYIRYATLHVPTASIDAYKATEPWSYFKTFVGLNGTLPDTPQPEIPKCATPTMAIKDGKLVFDCETEGVEYNCTITAADAKKLTGKEIDLAMTYKISVYASKADYEDSDIVTQEIKLFNGMRGDVNEDGVIDVADVVGVVNIILEKGDADASRTREKLRENGFVF